MSAETIAAVLVAGITVLGVPAAAVLWVRNSLSALRHEVEREMAAVEQRVLSRIEQERATADRLYASQTAVAEVAQQIRSMTEAITDVRRTVHDMWSEMQKRGRRRSYSPSGGT